jgi:acetyltransferase-like isoleucine patch superfamily enzyme
VKLYYSIGNLLNTIIVNLLLLFNFKKYHTKSINYFESSTLIELDRQSSLKIEGNLRMKKGSIIKVRKNANLVFGKNVSINHNSIIVCRKSIKIGSDVQIGPNVMIYDHNHSFNNGVIEKDIYEYNPVSIGNNVWIGANVVILPGAIIGDDSVVAAGSIVKGKNDNNNLIYNRRSFNSKKIMVGE